MPCTVFTGDQKGRDRLNMAQKRMFSRQITESDAFLDLPLSAQCLYFHLSLSADDEGFISSGKRIVRAIGATEEDLKLLVDGQFLIYFPEANVYVDRAFHLNNALRSDRSHPTPYQHQRKQLTLTDNKQYQLIAEDDNQMSTKCPADGDIDKNSPEEKRKDKKSKDQVSSGEGSPEGGTQHEGMDQNDILLIMADQAGIRSELEPVLNRYGFDTAHDAYTAWKKAGGIRGKYKDYVSEGGSSK